MPYKQQKKIILINNCIEIGLSDSDGPFSSIRISIPKKIVKSAVQRNKRQIKEIYRCSFQKNLNKNFLVKFKKEGCVFKEELKEFFSNV
jgi:RNase P protein component